MKRVTLVQNPAAGQGASAQKQFQRALEQAGYDVTAVEPDHGLGKSLARRTDVVIAAGGDGTVLGVARRLVGTNIPLMILPLGTANNLANSVGVAPEIEGLLQTLENPLERDLDIGLATGSWGERYFCESAGVGLFCDLLKDVVDESDKSPAHAVRVLGDFLANYKPRRFELTIDGDDASGEYLMVEVMNAKLLGPNLVLSQHASPWDEQLDVVLVRQKDKQRLATYLMQLESNPHATPPKFETRRCSHVSLRLDGEALRIDDSLRPKKGAMSSHFADLRLLPGAVRLWLPQTKKPMRALKRR